MQGAYFAAAAAGGEFAGDGASAEAEYIVVVHQLTTHPCRQAQGSRMESRDLHAVTQGDAGRAAQYRLRVISTHFTQSAAPSSHWAHAGSPLQPPNIEPPQLLKITKVGPKSGHAGPPIVVGGMVLDVLAVPDEKSSIAAGTTVPGKIKQAPGGVGRNIAQCIAALASESSSEPPLIISVVGRDPAGDALVGHLR